MTRQPIRCLKNEQYNFTENDVDVCEDLEQLRDWHNKVETDVQVLEGKYQSGKQKKESVGGVSDNWLERIDYAIGIQKKLLKMIESRIVKLRNNPPDTYFVEVKFVEEAEKMLDEYTFNEILRKARLGNGTENSSM
jgi:hypothetical protein